MDIARCKKSQEISTFSYMAMYLAKTEGSINLREKDGGPNMISMIDSELMT